MDELNPGIVRTVGLLRLHGFRTTDSGDGETHDHGCDRDIGYVSVVLSAGADMVKEVHDLYDLLVSAGVDFDAVEEPGGHPVVGIQASYSPVDKLKILDVSGIHDRMLVKEHLVSPRVRSPGEGMWR
jgi:hypothetical protein